MKEYIVENLAQYFDTIKEIQKKHNLLWFRGHACDFYRLEPSIYRAPFNARKEESFMELFKAKGVKFFANKTNYYEWLFIMQHYGTPTRMLDWSESAIVGIAFATQYRPNDDKSKDSDAVVWCLDPFALNKIANYGSEENTIINICEDDDLASIFRRECKGKRYPVAILGSYNSDRIIAQKGVFTLFPICDSFCLESDLADSEQFLTKIVIPSAKVDGIAQELYNTGFNELSLFPEPSSISKEIIRFDSIRKEK